MLKITFTMAVLFFVLGGCSDDKKADSSQSSSSKTTSPEVGKVEEESMYVRLYDEGLYPYYSSIVGDFTKKCEIASAVTGKTIDCIIDANELDLYFNGIKFASNFPSTMCEYVSFTPYWYYNFETGYGPSTVNLTINKDATGQVTSTACVFDGVSGCAGSEANFSGNNDSVECVYDRAASGGKNCCLGNYSKTVTTTTPAGSTTATTKEKWGGNALDCIGGPGKGDWKLYTKLGFPASEISYVNGKGLNSTYTVTAPIKNVNSGYTLPVANYYKPYSSTSSTNHRHTGYTLTRSSDLPYMVDPIDDRNGSQMSKGSAAYTWQCLDKNRDIINQINVYVREWNTYAEFLKYGTSQGVSGNPDIIGPEGTICNYQNSGDDCEDFLDLDYFKGPNSAPNRNLYFPALEY